MLEVADSDFLPLQTPKFLLYSVDLRWCKIPRGLTESGKPYYRLAFRGLKHGFDHKMVVVTWVRQPIADLYWDTSRIEHTERYLHVEFHMSLGMVVRGKISSESKPGNNNTQWVLDWWIWKFVTDSRYRWMGAGKSYFIAFILNECHSIINLLCL